MDGENNGKPLFDDLGGVFPILGNFPVSKIYVEHIWIAFGIGFEISPTTRWWFFQRFFICSPRNFGGR